MVASYEGLSRRQKQFIVGGAIFAVLLSLGFAAWIMENALRHTQFSQQDQEVVLRLLGDTTDPLQKSILRAHAIDTVANLKKIANTQSIMIVAFAGGFALFAVGIALLLLGADRAFRLQSEQGKSGLTLLWAGAAPGVVCFFLALILMGLAVTHQPSINPTSLNFPKQAVAPPENIAPRLPAVPDVARDTEAKKAREAQEQRNAEREAKNRADEKVAAAKLAAEKAAADKLMADKLALAKAAAEKAVIAKSKAEKSAADKMTAQRATDARLAALKAAAAKSASDSGRAVKLAADRAAAERVAADKLRSEKLRADKLSADKAAADKAGADKVASIKRAADKAASDSSRAEKSAAEQVDVASLVAQKIAAAGAPPEIYKRALALRNEGETSQALALLRYASSNGHAPSSRLLATLYREGAPDVRPNFRLAEKYKAAADSQSDR